MEDNSKAVFISLDQIQWAFDEIIGEEIIDWSLHHFGHQEPPSTPFLWTIFFKIDGESINTQNQAVLFPTNGNHGDLEVGGVSPFQVIPVPENVGTMSMTVSPMPDFITQAGLSSIFGVIIVLMNDGGNVSANGIEAGHEALNNGAQALLNSLVQQAMLNFSPPTPDEIEAAIQAAKLPDSITNAIESQQSVCENAWSLSGQDEEIGHVVLQFNLNDFGDGSETQPIIIGIPDDFGNTWRVMGSVTVSNTCPASAGAETLNRIFNGLSIGGREGDQGPVTYSEPKFPKLNELLNMMRDFRERKQLLNHTAFSDWWHFIKTHSPELACRLGTSEVLKTKMKPLIEAMALHLQDDNKKLSKKTINEVVEVLEILQEKATCKLRNELRASKVLISRMEDYTLSEVLQSLATRRLKRGQQKKT